jgi:hypothetical protein
VCKHFTVGGTATLVGNMIGWHAAVRVSNSQLLVTMLFVLLPCFGTCSLTDDGDVAARMLTTDHNGMNECEAARIRLKHSDHVR